MPTWLGPLLIQLSLVVGSVEAQPAWRPMVSHFPPGTESAVVNSVTSGREYQVWVALPRSYPDTTEQYPVLYTLDANGQFGTVTETARLLRFQELVPELVIVGVGYPVGHYLDAVGKRALDLTISVDRSFQLRPPFPQPEGTGGAPAFLGFLIEELIPLIERRYRVESEGRALIGHSFGGLFVTYALLHARGAFTRFVAGSPALWWDDRIIFDEERKLSSSTGELDAKAYFSIGLLEPAGQVDDLRRWIVLLEERRYRGLEWSAHFFEDETHDSVVPATISRGLRYIYSPR